MTDAVLFERVAVIGLGLIGSSLCWRIRQDGMARHIAGYARTAATRDKAMELGFIDSAHDTAAQVVEDADLIVLCAPIGANAAIAAEIGPRLKRGAIVTDVGSVKACVVRDVGNPASRNCSRTATASSRRRRARMRMPCPASKRSGARRAAMSS